MIIALACVNLLFSIVLITWIFKKIKNRWLSIAIILVILRWILDASLAPLVSYLFHLSPKIPIFPQALVSETPIYMNFLTSSYLMFLCGLFFAPNFGKKSQLTALLPNCMSKKKISDWELRAKNASQIIFCFGLVNWMIVFSFLLRNNSLFELASIRASFTDVRALSSPIYHYAMSLLPFMQVGSWGMLLFSRRMSIGIAACVLDICFGMLLGGRSSIVIKVVSAFFIFFLGNSINSKEGFKLLKSFFFIGCAITIGLLGVSFLRYGGKSFWASTFEYILYQRRLDQVAFAFNYFPDTIPYLQGGSLLSGISQIIPGLSLSGSINLWHYVASYIFPNYVHKGIGGFNFATCAENYMNFGMSGIVFIPLVYALFFGILVKWCWNNRRNRFMIMLYIATMISLLSSVDAKATYSIANFFTNYLLPISLIAFLTNPKNQNIILLLSIFFIGSATLIGSRIDADFVCLKYITIVCISFIYIKGITFLSNIQDLPFLYLGIKTFR
jgi:oligosaccharide repeat unit polymerase